LVLGLNRWVYRVIAYVALLRDEYPPFHLDMGAADPGDAQRPPVAGPSAGPASALPTDVQDPATPQ
jgi:hypothetical protein